jgi:integration host factor subunit alpha
LAPTLSRREIAYAIRSQLGVPSEDAEEWVRFLIEEIVSALERGEEVQLSGLGSFLVKRRGSRKGRNLVNGEEVHLPPRFTVVFRMGPRLKRRLNPPRQTPARGG